MELNDYIALAVIAISAYSDLRWGKIYNKVTYSTAIVGLLLPMVGGQVAWVDAVIGLLLGFIPLLIVHTMGGIGGGDVKLMGALGALTGYPFILHIMFYSFLIGGLLALSLIIWQGRFLEIMRRMAQNVYLLVTPGTRPSVPNEGYRIPFGFAICMGTLWALVLKIIHVALI